MAESSGKIVSNNVNLQLENKSLERSESVEENKTETVMEPMLLEDYKEDDVPRSLQNIFGYFKNKGVTLDKADITVIFIYILMLETGFVPSGVVSAEAETNCNFHYQRLLALTKTMPQNWKKCNSTYTLSFILAPHPAYVCTITCIRVSDDLVVNCSIRCSSEATQNLSMLLDPAMYIVNTSPLLQSLQDLSRRFKTTISNSCKIYILRACCMRPACLNCLPPEIFNYIRKYCDKTTALSLDRSC